MENSNEFLGTERIGKLMQKYAIPCIISLLVGALDAVSSALKSARRSLKAWFE